MAIVQEVVGREHGKQQQHEQRYRYIAIVLSTLHCLYIRSNRAVGTTLAKELREHLIVICVQIDVMHGKSRNRNLITQGKKQAIVHLYTVTKPLQFDSFVCIRTFKHHSTCAVAYKHTVCKQVVKHPYAAIRQLQRAMIVA